MGFVWGGALRDVPGKPLYIRYCTGCLVTASVAPRLTPILATKKAELGSVTRVFHNLTFGSFESGRGAGGRGQRIHAPGQSVNSREVSTFSYYADAADGFELHAGQNISASHPVPSVVNIAKIFLGPDTVCS